MLEFLEPRLALSISSKFHRLPFAFVLSLTACWQSKPGKSNRDEARIFHGGLSNWFSRFPSACAHEALPSGALSKAEYRL